MKTFGKILSRNDDWILNSVEPHVMIKLKAIFEFIPKSHYDNLRIPRTPERSRDLLWFINRYPLEISESDLANLEALSQLYTKLLDEAEAILAPNRPARIVDLAAGKYLRPYQASFVELFSLKKRMILGDVLGLGKTISGIGVLVNEKAPAIVVCQSHLTAQWKAQIEAFSNLRVHVAKRTKPYTITEPIDVLVISYSKLSGWTNALINTDFKNFFRGIIFDEIQELRHTGTGKYSAAERITQQVDYVLGLTGTPIYNYGIEAFNVFNLVSPGCLSSHSNFVREWCNHIDRVKDPKALGAYLRSIHVFLRRTWEDVAIERSDVNRVTISVETEYGEIKKVEERAKILAQRIFTGSFTERGEAARQFDIMVRHATGVAKAHGVADVVRMLLEDERKILLAGWHRDVYEIWKKELSEYNPVLYTGSETASQKEKSKAQFTTGDSRVMMISLRSGVGLDGLQHVARTVVIGELDWSPAVHDQVIGRLHRDGQKEQVHAYFCVADDGSDPSIVSILGIKSTQAAGIVDPFSSATEIASDDRRIKEMARRYLGSHESQEIKLDCLTVNEDRMGEFK